MFLLELNTSFKIVSSILNSRPLYARWGPRGGSDVDYLSALTPNMLLIGRANAELPIRNYSDSDRPLIRLQYVEECIAQWWDQFRIQNFSSLIPRQKWFEERRNMAVNDVVLISYEGKCKPGSFRLGVIRQVTVDPDGLVRTVEVEYSLLGDVPVSERYKYEGITKKKITVPVQRLVLILSAEEQNDLPGGQTCKSAVPLDEVHGVWSLSSGVDCGRIEVASVSAVLKSGLKEELKLNVKSC